jgi:hypothetical protein
MRTKTMILSALLGALGSVSVMAQTNVYSLNAVGYINVTITPGFNMISCPLIETPDNTLGTVLNNANSNYNGATVYFWFPTATPPQYSEDAANIGGKFGTTNANGWVENGTNIAAPGVGFWYDSPVSNTITFVGTVPTGSITNTLVPGFNLVGSVVPMSGDLVTNPLSALTNYNVPNGTIGGDQVYTFNASNNPVYTEYATAAGKFGGYGYNGNWTSNSPTSVGDPIIPFVGEGFWYDASVTIKWVENYSVAQ